MTKENIISYFFIALLLFIVYQIVLIFAPFIQSLFWSAIIAFTIFPVYERVNKMLNGRQAVAAFITTVVFFLVVIPPVVILIANIAAQAVDLYQISSDYIREGHLENLIDRIRAFPIVQKVETQVFQWEPLKQNATDWLLNASKSITNFSVSQVGTLTKNIFFVILNVLLTAFLMFIFLSDGRLIYNFIYQIAPLEEKNKRAIFLQINETFSAVIRGQLVTSLVQALIAGTVFWFLGLPLAIFFGLATFITTLIPVLGAATIWVPLAVYLVIMQSYVKAIILCIVGIGLISIVDNVMKPAIIGEKTKLPYFLLFFGILGGIKLYGLLGVFLAPVILSLFFSLVKIYQEKFFQPS